ncbi:MAG TPA: glycosyltransferase family 39 protein [Patescibacteria group bacterium]|nr:glycosyltransferase family 39 protein [Patescibacteria group bacterium]
MKNRNLILGLIILLGLILRFFWLGKVPVSLHRDEAFLGYNAYSILKTGKDISGNFMPIHLESFFFSPAGYSYFSIPFIAIFGLNQFSVRVASALFGTLTIPLIYLLTISLFKKNKSSFNIAYLTAFIFAISPWSIDLSRVSVENTIVLFFICLGTLLYVSYVNNKKLYYLIFAFVSFFLTLFIYQAPRAFLPLFIPFLFIVFSGGIKKIFLNKLPWLLYLILIILPVVLIVRSPDLSWRLQSLSILNNPATKIAVDQELVNDTLAGSPYLLARTIHNKPIGYLFTFTNNFFKHLSFDFLFSDGGYPDRFRIPQVGLLYLFEFPLILLGIYYLIRRESKIITLLAGWIVLGIVGTAITFDDIPNLQRTLIILPALSILSGYGLYSIYEFVLFSKKSRKVFVVLAGLIIFANFTYYIFQYYTQGRFYRTWYRQDGYEKLVTEVNKLAPNYKYIVVTSKESAPTILFLFYSKYDPATFQKETSSINMKESDHVNFSKYRFSVDDCPLKVDEKEPNKLTGVKKVLYVNSNTCSDIEGVKLIDTIKRVDGSDVFKLMEIK